MPLEKRGAVELAKNEAISGDHYALSMRGLD